MGRKNHSHTVAQGRKRPKHTSNRVVLVENKRVVVTVDKPHYKVGETKEQYQVRLDAWYAARRLA